MTREFKSHDEALCFIREYFGIKPGITYEVVDKEPVVPLCSVLLRDDPDSVTRIADTVALQKTYRFMENGDEYEFPAYEEWTPRGAKEPLKSAKIHFTVGPFRDGFSCWMIEQSSGATDHF